MIYDIMKYTGDAWILWGLGEPTPKQTAFLQLALHIHGSISAESINHGHYSTVESIQWKKSTCK